MTPTAHSYDADVIVIGGGIVGLSTALRLSERQPGISVVVLEKEAELATHQTGHNSGVIHAGVYYAPDSLKARFCREGSAATYEFCDQHGLAYDRCGKLIVATNDVEIARLKDLYQRCKQNQLSPELLDGAALRRLEPHIEGRAAIRVASSGIVDYPAIARTMAALLKQAGGEILLGWEVSGIEEGATGVTVTGVRGRLRARHAVVCGGLMADRLARMCKIDVDFQIIPFRGEYFRLPSNRDDIVSHLIYPVPDPNLPFLGVHLTRMIGGYVTVGPNAVLALAREAYSWRQADARDLFEMARFRGFWRMVKDNARSGVGEFRRSLWRRGYLELCRRYCPELTLADLKPYPAGVRAQAVMSDGSLVHDFLIRRSRRTLHVCNAPSPAATSAIPIGGYLADEFAKLQAA